MKKFVSGVAVLFIVLSQLQIGQVYAQNLAQLEAEKQKGEQVLDAMEGIIDTAVEKLDDKIQDASQSQQLQEKHEEIGEYLEKIQSDIAQENSQSDIKEKVEEAKKVVVLKVVSGVTEYENVEENISSDVASTSDEIEDAMESIQDSLETESGDYSIIIRTKYESTKVSGLFGKFDADTDIKFMYQTDDQNYFEVFLKEDSIFRQEMLEDISSGILPESFVGMKIVLPEVYSIGSEQQNNTFAGENLSKTWGIERYKSYQYFSDISTASKNIKVGVVDTGIDYNHPDLKNNVNQDLGKDFVNDDDDAWDDQGHGTHVAGTIAANINGAGIIGVNPYVELVPLKICTDKGFCPSYAVLRALDYAKQHKIDILNMSLGGRGDPTGHAICGAIESVTQAGTIVVAASGNSNIDTSRFVPGGCKSAITVAAVDSAEKRAVFSNYGSKVDVAAPGVNVYSTYPVNKGSYKQLSGTSMATPHIVGLVSLIQAYKPDITSKQVKELFQNKQSSVQTESSKYIAAGVDISAMLSYLKMPVVIEELVVNEEPDEQKVEEVKEEQKQETEDRYEVLLDTVTYVDEEIIFIENQEKQDEEVRIANTQLESRDDIKISNINISPASLDMNIFGENDSVGISSNSGDDIETGTLELENVSQIKSGNIFSETQIFSESGALLPVTKINNTYQNTQEMSGSLLPINFDVYNLPENNFIPNFSGVEINNFENNQEAQDIFIDGSEKGIEINSSGEEEQGEDFVFFTGSDIGEQMLYDEEGNVVDISSLDNIEIIHDDLDFSFEKEIFMDGVEAGVEINSFGEDETPSEEIIEISNYSSDIILGEEGLIPEGEVVYDVSSIQENINIPTPSEGEFFIDGAEKGIEINNIGESEDFEPEVMDISEFIDNERIVVEGEDILGYEGEDENSLEINNLEGENEEIFDIEFIETESLSFGDINNEVILPGAQGGIEINNFGDDAENGEPLNIEEYDEDSVLFSPEFGQEIEIPEELENDPKFDNEVDENIGDEAVIQDDTVYSEGEYSDTEDAGGIGLQSTYTCEIEVGEWCSFSMYKSYRYSFNVEGPGIADRYSSKRTLQFKGKQVGSSTYRMYRYGRHYHTIYVTVKEPSPPIEHTLEIEINKWGYLQLPDHGFYRIYKYNDTGLRATMYQSGNRIKIYAYNYASTDYKLVDYRSGRVKHILHVKSVPPKPIEINISMMLGTTSSNYLVNSFEYTLSSPDWSYIKSVQRNSRNIYVTGNKVGTTQIYLSKAGVYKYILNIEIESPPEPKEYTINVEEGKYVNIYLPQREDLRYVSEKMYEGQAYLYNYSRYGYVQLRGVTLGNKEYFIKDRNNLYVKYKIIVHIIPKPPIIYDVNVYETRSTSRYIVNSHAYEYSTSDSSKVSYSHWGNRYVSMSGLQSGKSEIYLKKDNVVKYIFRVNVLPVPTPQEYNVKIFENQRSHLYLPKGYYNIYKQAGATGQSNFYGYRGGRYGRFDVAGISQGKQTYFIFDKNYGFHRYTVHVDVTIKEPVVKEISIYEGRFLPLGDCRYHSVVGQANDNFNYYKSGRHCYLKSMKAGYGEVLLKASNTGYYDNYLYKITILAIPTPQEYTVKFTGGNGSANVYLPVSINEYNISYQGNYIYDNLKKYDKHFWIDVERVGTAKILLKDKSYGYTRYIINVISEPSYEEYTINETDYLRVWDNDNYDFNEQNKSVVRYGVRDKDGYIYGSGVGETEIHIYSHKYGLRKIWKVTVLPKPEPIEVICETEVGKQCELMLKNGGYYYNTNIPYGSYDIDSWRDKFRFKSERSGEYTAYIKSFHGNYITHIFKIRVKPRAAKVLTCDMAVGGICDLGWVKTNSRSLTFQQTNPGLVHVLYTRKDGSGTKSENEEYEKGAYDHEYKNIDQGFRYKISYQLKTHKEGKGDIYIFDGGEHLYTIKINSFVVNPILLEDSSLKVRQGDKISTKILRGGGKYNEYAVHSSTGAEIKIDYFDTDSDKDKEGFYLPTGEVTLKHSKVGKYYPIISDRYNQTKQISLTIKDVDLRLSSYIPSKLEVDDLHNIEVLDRYQRIVEISQTKGQEILRTRYVRDTRNDREYIQITALKPGSTTLKAEDAEGNIATIKINISGKIVEEKESVEEEVSLTTIKGLEVFLESFLNESTESNNTKINSIEIKSTSELSLELETKIDLVIQKYYKEKGRDRTIYIKDKISENIHTYEGLKKQVAVGLIDSILEVDRGLYISDVHVTPDIDEGYMGGIYLESNIAVQEVGFETVYNNNKAFSSSNKNDMSVGKIHASILLPECLESCSFGIRGYVQDFLGRKKYTEIYSISYAGGEKMLLDNSDFQIANFSNTSDSIDVANAKWAAIKKAVHGIFLFVGLIDTAVCSVIDNVGCGINVVGGIVQGIGNKTKDVVRGTYKRVLKLANKKDVNTLAQDLGKNADNLESVLKTPGGNPIRYSVSAVNSKQLSSVDASKHIVYADKFTSKGNIFYLTELGRDSKYVISYNEASKELVLHDVFKGNIDIKGYNASKVLYDMIEFYGIDKNFKKIKIDKLIHLESVDDLKDGKVYLGTKFGKTTQYLIDAIGLDIKDIYVSKLIRDGNVKYGEYFDVEINF